MSSSRKKRENVQRSTLNVQRSIYAFDIGRWTLGVRRLVLNALQNSRSFRHAVLRWYENHGRDLPWRRNRDPYATLVSEFMLQQTQVVSVLPHYHAWLRRFPDFGSLARAPGNDVLHAWQGLGYYARARNLHAAAKIIATKHRGQCPQGVDELRSLPGIGRYTANAIATFAFNQPVPVVDANIARLLARLLNIRVPIDSAAGRDSVWSFASQLIDQSEAGVFNSALMDLGATICVPRAPKCGICPVKKFCQAKNPGMLPIKKVRPRLKRLRETHAFVVRQNKILLEQSAPRWRGMWILPPVGIRSKSSRPIHTSTFPFTHHRVKLVVFWQKRRVRSKRQRWFSLLDIDSIPLPSPHRRAIVDLLQQRNSSPN
jgi:A/G-specific adenine glycosylase